MLNQTSKNIYRSTYSLHIIYFVGTLCNFYKIKVDQISHFGIWLLCIVHYMYFFILSLRVEFSWSDFPIKTHRAPKHPFLAPNRYAGFWFVLVQAGVAQAIGWKTMTARRGSARIVPNGYLLWKMTSGNFNLTMLRKKSTYNELIYFKKCIPIIIYLGIYFYWSQIETPNNVVWK